LRQLIELKTI